MTEQAAAAARVNVYGQGEATVETGLPVLNRLITRLAETARFDLVLDIEVGDTQAEVEAAAAAIGRPRRLPTSCSRQRTSRSSSRTST
jgi:imidazoleglycerol phosphate dehydratase HisB